MDFLTGLQTAIDSVADRVNNGFSDITRTLSGSVDGIRDEIGSSFNDIVMSIEQFQSRLNFLFFLVILFIAIYIGIQVYQYITQRKYKAIQMKQQSLILEELKAIRKLLEED